MDETFCDENTLYKQVLYEERTLPCLHHTAIDHIFNATYGDTGFRDIGTDDNLPGAFRSGIKHRHLLHARLGRVERANFHRRSFDFRVFRKKADLVGTGFDFFLPREKYQDIVTEKVQNPFKSIKKR